MSARTLTMLGAAVLLAACGGAGPGESADTAVEQGSAAAAQMFDVTMDAQDSIIFAEKIDWARQQRLDTLPVGRIMAELGRTFVGAPYTPGTLELEGPERLVVNLRELDCVTFVENMLAMARVLRAGTADFDSFQRELVRIRYRGGALAGYPSRLHYFSEWIADNEQKGVVEDITADLGGVVDAGDLNFMSRNSEAYRQLADSAVAAEIRTIETALTGRTRHYIPEGSIAELAAGIQDGDIIAATSTLDGLDIAHTGLALWVDGRLHLMHAPLVGSVVEISEQPLADRIQRISAQDGIMVARPR